MSYDGYGWIKVKKYEVDANASWEERYKQLEAHHIEETSFLIATVRKLAHEIDYRQQSDWRKIDEENAHCTT